MRLTPLIFFAIGIASSAHAIEPFAGSYALGLIHSKFEYEVMKSRALLGRLTLDKAKLPKPCSEAIENFERIVTESQASLSDADKWAADGTLSNSRAQNQLRVHFEDVEEILKDQRMQLAKRCVKR